MTTTRSTRSQRKTELRKKNVGIGVHNIEIDPDKVAKKGKKITFDDDYVASDYESSSDLEEKKEIETNHSGEESSDDEIEQVDNSLAKIHAMEQRAAESKSRREEYATVNKRKRKAKAKDEKPDIKATDIDSDDELDEDFLSMVDSDRKSEAKAKKQLKVLAKEGIIGKHTTFVSDGDNLDAPGSINSPIQADHNIDIVVLPGLNFDDDADSNAVKYQQDVALSASLGTQPSTTAISLCRGRIENFQSEEQGLEVKRSRKMKYNLSKGRASINFKVRC
jgi:hypothetical protein